MRFITTRTTAVWQAVERPCATGDFRPAPERAVRQRAASSAWCPAFGGDPDRAAVEARGPPASSRPRRDGDRTIRRRRPGVPPQVAVAPGRSALGPAIARFDRWADVALERMRGNPVADAVFMTAATELGDFSLIWHLVNVAPRAHERRRADQVPVLAARPRRREPHRQPGPQAPVPAPAPDGRGRPALPGAPAADVVVPVRARQRGRVHGRAADDVGRPALGAAVVGARRAPSASAGPTCASTTPPTSSPAWPPAPRSASARGAILRRTGIVAADGR